MSRSDRDVAHRSDADDGRSPHSSQT